MLSLPSVQCLDYAGSDQSGSFMAGSDSASRRSGSVSSVSTVSMQANDREEDQWASSSGLATRRLQQNIDPASRTLLNAQQCVADTTIFPYDAFGILLSSVRPLYGCGATLVAPNVIYTVQDCYDFNQLGSAIFYQGRSSCSGKSVLPLVTASAVNYSQVDVSALCSADYSDYTIHDCNIHNRYGLLKLNRTFSSYMQTASFSGLPAMVVNSAGYAGLDNTTCQLNQ